MFWYKFAQEATSDLPAVGRILSKQNPTSLKWAGDRLWEFLGIIGYDFDLSSDRNANGLDWTGYDVPNKNDLLFFDHYFGQTHPYDDEGCSLRLGLQCWENIRPRSLFEVRLLSYVSVRDEEGFVKRVMRLGEIVLSGEYGVWWRVKVSFNVIDKRHLPKFKRLLPFFCKYQMEDDCGRDEFEIGCSGPVTAKEAKEIFNQMVNYYKSERR